MIQRTLTTIVLWLALIGLLWKFESTAAVGIVTLLSLLTQHEFYVMLRSTGQRPFRKLGLVLGAAIILIPWIRRLVGHTRDIAGLMAALLALAIIICCIRILREREPEQRVETLASTLFGVIYVPFMMHFLVEIFFLTPDATAGLLLAVWLVVVVKFGDVGALLIGTAFGRHKMAPTISPKKSWEGLAGGLLVATLAGTGLVVALRPHFPPQFTPLASVLIAVPIALLGVLSDLVESMIKRKADMKDSGRTVPGIGGAFDLTDSIILPAPVACLVFSWLLHSA